MCNFSASNCRQRHFLLWFGFHLPTVPGPYPHTSLYPWLTMQMSWLQAVGWIGLPGTPTLTLIAIVCGISTCLYRSQRPEHCCSLISSVSAPPLSLSHYTLLLASVPGAVPPPYPCTFRACAKSFSPAWQHIDDVLCFFGTLPCAFGNGIIKKDKPQPRSRLNCSDIGKQ